MELKTLKDLKDVATVQLTNGNTLEYKTKDSGLVSKSDLRQEAIKRIKKIQQLNKEIMVTGVISESEVKRIQEGVEATVGEAFSANFSIIKWIKHFFNIIDKDLEVK